MNLGIRRPCLMQTPFAGSIEALGEHDKNHTNYNGCPLAHAYIII
jgi:hypothetical protein